MHYSSLHKEITLRFLNPLSTKVRVFKFNFKQEVITLVGEDTFSEKIIRLQKQKREAAKAFDDAFRKKLDEAKIKKLEEELEQLKTKLANTKHEHKLS